VEAWLVGGAVRDALLGVGDSEIDAAISGDPEPVARALESAGAGRAVFLSRGRPGPRVFRVAGKRPVDIAELEGGSIETDLRRRDFTVNAMGVSIADGTLRDPFGGAADLARRRLRPVRAENLLEDPLRALRAARLFCTLGLMPDSATLAAARAAAPALPRVAAERIATELSRILGSPRAAGALAWAARAGILEAAIGLEAGDRRASRLPGALRPFDDPATVRLGEGIRRRLRLAALALGLRFEAAEARRWLLDRRLPRREAEDAGRLVELALRPPGPALEETWRWIVEAGPLAEEAIHILERRHPRGDRGRPGIARLRRLARKPRRSVPVTGADVMRWLELPSGPRIGRLLSELAVAIASGKVKNRREARNWLTGQVRKASSAL
jgi:tRNA nucleotidyltransferase/poly(A) polymerase